VAKRAKTKTPEQLEAYRAKRDPAKTPEPSGERGAGGGDGNRFVVHEHHARRLHWDLRLEHDGVLLSFALPRGIPADPSENRLAVHTEDHPVEYLDFHGTIPKGEYGAGEMTIWDQGTYEPEKIEEAKLVVRLHGERVRGRYALFQTRGDDWMIHRMDPPEADREPMPEHIEPMKATLAKLPRDEAQWGYEIKWDGVRAIAYLPPGHLTLVSRNLREITGQYPEVRGIARELDGRPVALDGELVAFDDEGRPSFQRLQHRMHVASDSEVRRRMRDVPVTYVVFDLLHLDGATLFEEPYEQRRELLESLRLDGESWQTPAYHRGEGAALLEASRTQGLEGIVAKRLDSPYRPGKRGRDWLKVKNVRGQEVVIGGWLPGKGRREGELGALLVGYYDDGALRYAGKVGTGFGAADLRLLRERLEPLRADASPFEGRQPQKGSIFVAPELVAQVEFAEWTNAGTLRHASYEGLRDDKPARDVVREEPAA
jgi:bifunctional non-homologous end joining protein LigD